MIDATELPTIPAERVALRWMTESDIGDLYTIFSSPVVTRYWSTPPMTDEANARLLLKGIQDSFAEKSLFQWGLALKTDNSVIGTCTLAGLDVSNRRAELGYALGHDHWGRGYMREALETLLDFAFTTLNLRRLEADVDPRNEASIRTLVRLGFQKEGHLRERWDVNGELQDSLMYGLLQREWRV